MSRFLVKVYFMHEREEQAAKAAVDASVIEKPEWTEGYVMGTVEESSIESLRKEGLIVTPIERLTDPPLVVSKFTLDEIPTLEGPINTRFVGAARPYALELVGTEKLLPRALFPERQEQKILSSDRRRPEYYVARFHGPLTTERKRRLRRYRIEPNERVTRNRYVVRLTPAQVRQLAGLEFVDWIRLYDAKDTLQNPEAPTALAQRTRGRPRGPRPAAFATTAAAAPAALAIALESVTTGKTSRMSLFAVRVHRAADLKLVVRWLQKRKIKPLWQGQETLRVAFRNPSKELTALASLREVASVEELRAPQPFDECADRIVGIPSVRQGASRSPLRGDGETIAIADTGLDDTHPDFKGRIRGLVALGRPGDTSDPEGHGTHVAGCAAGDGNASGGVVVGAAPAAKIFFQSVLDANGGLGGLPEDLKKLFLQAYKAGARIHNNSWGTFSFANYPLASLQVDEFVYNNSDMLIVIAAGNEGVAKPRVVNGPMNAGRGFVDWPSVAAPATSKNGLTVGASRSSRTEFGYSRLRWGVAWADRYPEDPIAAETISGDDQSLAAFSSRGPSDDQRIKPDVVAPGTDIAATRSKSAPLRKFWGAYPNNNHYGFMGGTSMATPYVSGCAALVREWYRKERRNPKPSAALIKATLINGTCRLTGRDAQAAPSGNPNFHQGFGRINLATSLPNASQPTLSLAYTDTWTKTAKALKETGARHRFEVTVAAGTPLRLCLTWTDPPARGLQNGLLLLVDNEAREKWVGNSGAAALVRVSGTLAPDPNNNVQTVRVEAPSSGRYTIAVTAQNLLKPPQHYALVITGDLRSSLLPLS